MRALNFVNQPLFKSLYGRGFNTLEEYYQYRKELSDRTHKSLENFLIRDLSICFWEIDHLNALNETWITIQILHQSSEQTLNNILVKYESLSDGFEFLDTRKTMLTQLNCYQEEEFKIKAKLTEWKKHEWSMTVQIISSWTKRLIEKTIKFTIFPCQQSYRNIAPSPEHAIFPIEYY